MAVGLLIPLDAVNITMEYLRYVFIDNKVASTLRTTLLISICIRGRCVIESRY
jgi:hypothetical protein